MKWTIGLFFVSCALLLIPFFNGCWNYQCYEYKTERKYIEPYTYMMYIGDIWFPVSDGGHWTSKEVCVKDNYEGKF